MFTPAEVVFSDRNDKDDDGKIRSGRMVCDAEKRAVVAERERERQDLDRLVVACGCCKKIRTASFHG